MSLCIHVSVTYSAPVTVPLAVNLLVPVSVYVSGPDPNHVTVNGFSTFYCSCSVPVADTVPAFDPASGFSFMSTPQ